MCTALDLCAQVTESEKEIGPNFLDAKRKEKITSLVEAYVTKKVKPAKQ